MWAEAAKWLAKFDEAVLTLLDADGYPVSVRVDPTGYDGRTGQLAATLPATLRAVEGPANLLCHYHDDKLWSLQLMTIKGRVARRDDNWVFHSTRFDAPSPLALFAFIKGARSSATKYLQRRGLSRPEVDWVSIKAIQRRIKS